MATHYGAIHRGECLNPIGVKSLTNPLAFIAEGHLRMRHICALMEALATGQDHDQADFERILTYLNVEFTPHLADEDDDLFPLLRKRCEPEDEIDKLLDRLEEDHRIATEQAPAVRDSLLRCVGGVDKLSSDECEALRTFSGNLRRHLVFENAIVLPLAQARLNAHDLDQLRQCLAARRTDGKT